MHQPIFLNREQKDELLKEKTYCIYSDVAHRQIHELYCIEYPNQKDTHESDLYTKFVLEKERGVQYIYFPWTNIVFSCVPETEYMQLRTNRNQDLITAKEQERLYRHSIAVLGLSVGSAILHTLNISGIGRSYTLADFDSLETTNMNRILSGVHEVGQTKIDVAARRVYEMNPYAELTTLPDGITKENVQLLKGMDCIIEEMDSFAMKIAVRTCAREQRIPVVMITDNGDGVVLHVERYDRGYKKIFGEEDAFWKKELSTPLTRERIAGLIMKNIGGAHMVDPRMMDSIKKVYTGQLRSWSQLGSAALLGGVVGTIAVKRILRGEDRTIFRMEHIRVFAEST